MREKVIPKTIYIFEFNNSENLFRFIEELLKKKYCQAIQSDLYSYDKKYRLILYANYTQKREMPLFIEFCDDILCARRDLTQTREFWKLITKHIAVQKMGAFL